MPFVRDYSYSTTGGTAATTIAVGVPDYEQNDLLVAMVSADGQLPANTTSVTGTGWTNIGFYTAAGNNAAGMSILVKYASASEPVDYTFSGFSSETLNGMIISIGDTFFDGGTGANAIQNRTTSTSTPNFTGTTYATLRQGYPAIASTADNSLILFFGVSGGTGTSGGVPTISEGIAHLLIGKDGGAHSDGAAWAYKKTAGTLAANSVYIRVSGNTSAAGYYAQMVVRPPAGGATIIPPYIVSDPSRLIDTATGAIDPAGYGALTTATGANSTVFPTATLTLNGRPVVAGGATYTAADQGVNTFHSGINILGVTTSGSWASNNTAYPAMTDLAGANILMHVSPQTPASGQSVDSVALAGACGFAVGLASTAGNCKVWHVHGNGTPWNQTRWVPCVINTSNTTGVIGTAGSINNNSIANIGFFLSCKGVAGAYTITSIWKMDTTIAAGGNAARPFTDADLVPVFAASKERRSIIAQGSKQYYVVQTCQFGNGGTDSIYLKLDDAAFEFPKQYDKTTRNVNYCSIDNKVGFIFYPGASDYISFKNCLFTSESKFVWQFNSASGAATVVSSGAKVSGAGLITLSANINLSDMTFNKCSEVPAAGGNLTAITFDATTASTGAVSITSSTIAGLQTQLNKLTDCIFTNNTTGAGLVINYTGSEAGPFELNLTTGKFSGNTFDIKWSPTTVKTLTVNVSGTANPTTITATTGSAFISNPKTLTVNSVPSGAEVRIRQGAFTLAYASNVTTGSYIYNYQYTQDEPVRVSVSLPGYVIEPIDTVLVSSNTSVTVVSVPDPSYV